MIVTEVRKGEPQPTGIDVYSGVPITINPDMSIIEKEDDEHIQVAAYTLNLVGSGSATLIVGKDKRMISDPIFPILLPEGPVEVAYTINKEGGDTKIQATKLPVMFGIDISDVSEDEAERLVFRFNHGTKQYSGINDPFTEELTIGGYVDTQTGEEGKYIILPDRANLFQNSEFIIDFPQRS